MYYYKSDKPIHLEDIKHNKKSISVLNQIKYNMNHLLVYGLNGSGKYTIIKAYLNSMFDYDNKIYNMKDKTIELSFNGSKVDFPVMASPYHFEINCEDFNDKRLVNQFIKSVACTNNISNNNKKIVIVKHIEHLTIEYQWMLRRTIEKLYKTCKIIFMSNHISRIDSSISSRCICLRIESPSDKEIENILSDISEKNNIQNISDKQMNYILKVSQRNLKTALVLFEYSLYKDNTKPELYHLQPIINVIDKINNYSKPKQIKEIRNDLHNLILYDVNLNLLQTHLMDFYILNKDISEYKREKLINIIKDINHSINFAYKKLYHLEALVTKIIIVLNTSEEELETLSLK
tara:strand:+ start:620 stop:1660 length:1041 start_codon:yes stop_codon:yes gene_type:complete